MAPKWKTDRGDEWFYSDHVIEARAGVNQGSSPPVFSVALYVRNRRDFSASALLRFLRNTYEEFPDFQIFCNLDNLTEPLLNELFDRGQLKWARVQHPYSSDAHVIGFGSADGDNIKAL